MSFILRFGIGHQEAEDLAQLTIHEYFRWWRVRRAARWLVEQSWAGRTQYEVSPERDSIANESLQRVRYVLHRMSHKLRDALVLLDIEGVSAHEAARLLGVPRNTMRSRHVLAREEFKRLWDRTQQRREIFDD
jgi:DNA-directed RNA polymerase specialized sigma24 family protein